MKNHETANKSLCGDEEWIACGETVQVHLGTMLVMVLPVMSHSFYFTSCMSGSHGSI